MKMDIRTLRHFIVASFGALAIISCTDLDEELRSTVDGDQANAIVTAEQLLSGAYVNLELFSDPAIYFAMQEHSSDELIGPTRGGDWDDNGQWRQMHTQEWTPDHPFVGNVFNRLLTGTFNANQVIAFPSAEPGQIAQALVLRSLFMACVADLYGQVPFREAGSSFLDAPQILSRTEAVDKIIADLNVALQDLPDTGAPEVITKNAARTLLSRVYLNKFIYEGAGSPSTDDMNQVISLSQEVINSGGLSLLQGADYYGSFQPSNMTNELILVINYAAGVPQSSIGNNTRSRWFMTLHYNQNPSGWNGFATLANFYNTFTDDNDVRKYAERQLFNDTGVANGFLVGQQFDGSGTPLLDRNDNPLIFTPEVGIIEAGASLEVAGIRGMKYTPDFDNGDQVDVDVPLMSLGEAYVNLAEAQWRNGDESAAIATINTLRAARGASPISAIDATTMLNERGFELWWEGFRRTDLIRFGKFNEAWEEKAASDPSRNLYPIPAAALAANPELRQNPGY
ncbi:MAG: RagB/SusD family nutrient uptake outer membrane protein [Bacteroidota bacterium]